MATKLLPYDGSDIADFISRWSRYTIHSWLHISTNAPIHPHTHTIHTVVDVPCHNLKAFCLVMTRTLRLVYFCTYICIYLTYITLSLTGGGCCWASIIIHTITASQLLCDISCFVFFHLIIQLLDCVGARTRLCMGHIACFYRCQRRSGQLRVMKILNKR